MPPRLLVDGDVVDTQVDDARVLRNVLRRARPAIGRGVADRAFRLRLGMKSDGLVQISDEYRRALRGFAATVTIVSCRNGLQNFGITVSAVTSISMMPPSLLIAVNEKSSIHPSLRASDRFCVNLLGESQEHHSRTFGAPMGMDERFDRGDWQLSPDDVPYLADAQANIFCRKVDTHKFGTHTMFVGQVYQLAIGDLVAPLIYLNGEYLKVSELHPVRGLPPATLKDG